MFECEAREYLLSSPLTKSTHSYHLHNSSREYLFSSPLTKSTHSYHLHNSSREYLLSSPITKSTHSYHLHNSSREYLLSSPLTKTTHSYDLHNSYFALKHRYSRERQCGLSVSQMEIRYERTVQGHSVLSFLEEDGRKIQSQHKIVSCSRTSGYDFCLDSRRKRSTEF